MKMRHAKTSVIESTELGDSKTKKGEVDSPKSGAPAIQVSTIGRIHKMIRSKLKIEISTIPRELKHK
jgi:hypothetical protein